MVGVQEAVAITGELPDDHELQEFMKQKEAALFPL